MDRIRNRRPSCSSTHASQRSDGFHGQHDRRACTSRIAVRWVLVTRSHLPSRCLGGSPPGSQSSRLAARTVTERADCGWARVVRVRGQSLVSFASRLGSPDWPRSFVLRLVRSCDFIFLVARVRHWRCSVGSSGPFAHLGLSSFVRRSPLDSRPSSHVLVDRRTCSSHIVRSTHLRARVVLERVWRGGVATTVCRCPLLLPLSVCLVVGGLDSMQMGW